MSFGTARDYGLYTVLIAPGMSLSTRLASPAILHHRSRKPAMKLFKVRLPGETFWVRAVARLDHGWRCRVDNNLVEHGYRVGDVLDVTPEMIILEQDVPDEER